MNCRNCHYCIQFDYPEKDVCDHPEMKDKFCADARAQLPMYGGCGEDGRKFVRKHEREFEAMPVRVYGWR